MTTPKRKITKPNRQIWWAVSEKPNGEILDVWRTFEIAQNVIDGGDGNAFIRPVLVTEIKRGNK